jgi:hypothetical protein
MRYARIAAFLLAFGSVGFVVHSAASLRRPFVLVDGERSIDALVQKLLAGLEAGDKDAVNRCLITKTDYVDFVLPGAGKPGDPPRHYTDEMNDYAWGTMYGKTIYFRANLLDRFAGKHYQVKAYEFRKGVNDYAWYRAHQRISIQLEDQDSGEVTALNTGSVLEVDGRYKFISLITD